MNVAARHMIPVEMLAALVSAVFGLPGWIGRGPLWTVLEILPAWGGLGQDLWWAIVLLCGGAVLLAAGCLEWFCGRHWGPGRLMLAADVRCGAALLLTVALVSLFGTALVSGESLRLLFFVLIAPVLCVFLLWSAFLTRRLSVSLDTKYRTPGLRNDITTNW